MQSIQFFSKQCKDHNHGYCDSKWTGLGLEVYCTCYCHNKKDNTLLPDPTTNKVITGRKKKSSQSIGDEAKTVAVDSTSQVRYHNEYALRS